jgi:hypothetical protein
MHSIVGKIGARIARGMDGGNTGASAHQGWLIKKENVYNTSQ